MSGGPQIEVLANKIPKNEAIRFHIGIYGGPRWRRIETPGFGLIIDDGAGNQFTPISFKSTSPKSTTQRGALGATLTALEFMAINCERGAKGTIFSKDEYVSRWLLTRISTWLTEPSRANLDLLHKINAQLPNVSVEIYHPKHSSSPQLQMKADELAEIAANGERIFYNDDDEMTEEQLNEWLRLRAMSKDPWG